MSTDNNKTKVTQSGLGTAPEKRVIKLNEGSKKARKTAARLASVQVWYQMLISEQNVSTVLQDFIDHRIGFELDGDVFVPADQDMLTKIVHGMRDERPELQEMIHATLTAKKHEAVEPLLQSILMAGLYELKNHHDIDAGIIIADYLNVTFAFYDKGGETRLINAVLDHFAKALRD